VKVLFISSGNSGNIGTVVKNQGESLRNAGLDLDYFLIKGNGFWGYISNIQKIRKAYLTGNYNIVHAHYSLSAFTASFAGSFPLIVSLMGSDAYLCWFWRVVARLFYMLRWNITIVKTQQMKSVLGMKKAQIIPNGVDLKRFKPISKSMARKHIDYSNKNKLVLFIANPMRYEKNYSLAIEAVKALNDDNVELWPVFNKSNSLINYYINAADVLLLTSKWEGSVNIIKEGMACNCPIVATDVGDIKWVIGDTDGCYISSFNPLDVANKVKNALEFSRKTEGRKRILELGLDSESIAEKIISIYKYTFNQSSMEQSHKTTY